MVTAAAAGTSSWVHPARSYPPAVQAEIARRREQVLARAHGRVLDLNDPDVAARFLAVGSTGFEASPWTDDDRYDTVVATGVLAGFADLGAVTAALARCVADDGALL